MIEFSLEETPHCVFFIAASYVSSVDSSKAQPEKVKSFTGRCELIITAFQSLWKLSITNSRSLVNYLGLCCITPSQRRPDKSSLSAAHAAEKRQISIQDQSLIHGCCRLEFCLCNVAAELFHSAVEVIHQQWTNLIYAHLIGCVYWTVLYC